MHPFDRTRRGELCIPLPKYTLSSRNGSVPIILVDGSAFHYELYLLQLGDVLQGVAADRHNVRPFPGFNGSCLVAQPKQLCRERRARANGLHRRHAVLHVVFKFLRLIYFFPVKSTCIRAESNSPKGARFLLRLPLFEHAESSGQEPNARTQVTEVRS